MTRTLMMLSTAVAGGLLALAPASASAQRWGDYGYNSPRYGYDSGYSRDARRDYWRDQKRERWIAKKRWERERRWRRDHDRRDWDRRDGYGY